jgi:hypothetical protein
MGNQFAKFKRTDSSEAELHEAAELLGGVVESASFWSAIANDESVSVVHRKLALVQLVRRHVVPGATTVGAFAEMLEGARWLNDDGITAITALGGKVPVTWSPDETVIAITLPGGRDAIYFAIAGRFAAEETAVALRGMSRDERLLSAVIRDAGIEIGYEFEKTAL